MSSIRSTEAPTLNSLDNFTEEEEMLRESGTSFTSWHLPASLTSSTVKRFATDIVAPKVREMDEKESMDPMVIKGLFEQGVSHPFSCMLPASYVRLQLMGIETSAEHGGAESSFTSAIIAIEELAKVDPSVSVMCDVHNTLVNTILRKYGTKEQQDKWLPQLSESKVCTAPESCSMVLIIVCWQLGSFCLSEPASGSDAFSLQTRAVKDGNHWVINGSKMWITNAYEAEIFLIFANVGISSLVLF